MSLQTGVYRVRNLQSGTYFDASHDDDTIHGWESKPHKPNQKWLVEKTDDGYILRTVENDKYAYVPDNKTATKLHASDKITYWDILPQSEGYVIRVHGTDQSVDLDSGNIANGTTILLNPASDKKWQIWHFEAITGPRSDGHHPYKAAKYTCDVEPGTYVIRNVMTGTVADLYGGKADEETPLKAFAFHDGGMQKWTLEPGNIGYKIKNVASGTYLASYDIQEFQDGIPLWGTKYGAQFIITAEGDEYKIFHPGADYVVDLNQGSTKEGTTISLWRNGHGPNQGANQRWRFEVIN